MSIESYLLDRGLLRGTVDRFLKISKACDVAGESFDASGFEYEINHFLDSSGDVGYDIELVNQALGTGDSRLVAIAIAEGDDPICIDLSSGNVLLWLLEDRERLLLASTFDEFASMIVGVG